MHETNQETWRLGASEDLKENFASRHVDLAQAHIIKGCCIAPDIV